MWCAEYVDTRTGEITCVVEMGEERVVFNHGYEMDREQFDRDFDWYAAGDCAACVECACIYLTRRMKRVSPAGDTPVYMCNGCYHTISKEIERAT